MKRIVCYCLPGLISALVAFMPSCTVLDAGNSQDVSSGSKKVAGTIYTQKGEPVSEAMVILRPSDYIAGSQRVLTAAKQAAAGAVFTCTTQTDDNGEFAFTVGDSIPPDVYALEASGPDGNERLFIDSISLDSIFVLSATWLCIDTPVFTPLLAPVSRITGKVDVGDDSAVGNVFIYGLDLSGTLGADGTFSIDNVPAGVLRLRVEAVNTDRYFAGSISVNVLPGSDDTIDNIDIEAIADTLAFRDEPVPAGALFLKNISGNDTLDDTQDGIVVEDGHGGFVFCSRVSANYPESGGELQLTFIDQDGDVVSKKRSGVIAEYLYSFKNTADGGYIASVKIIGRGTEKSNLRMIKFDNTGKTVWTIGSEEFRGDEKMVHTEQNIGMEYLLAFQRDTILVLSKYEVTTGIKLWEREYPIRHPYGVYQNGDDTYGIIGAKTQFTDTLEMIRIQDSVTLVAEKRAVPYADMEGARLPVRVTGYVNGPMVAVNVSNDSDGDASESGMYYLTRYTYDFTEEWTVSGVLLTGSDLLRGPRRGFVGLSTWSGETVDGRQLFQLIHVDSDWRLVDRYDIALSERMFPADIREATVDEGYYMLVYKFWPQNTGKLDQCPVAYLMKMYLDEEEED